MSQPKTNKFTLINLGGPRNREEIEIFLKDLFLDPYVFDLPLWEPLRKLLARYIARTRAPKVSAAYASMGYGGGSPLVEETLKQARAIEEELFNRTGKKWESSVAMACGLPNLRDEISHEIFPSKDHIHVPLFPQFSRSTILSLASIYQTLCGHCPVGKSGWVDPYAEDERFIRLTANFILEYFRGQLTANNHPHYENSGPISGWEEIDLIFSAHGIPMRLIEKGDRYVNQTKACVEGIEKLLRSNGFQGEVHLSFQSRVGRAKWTEPNTKDTLAELGAKGKDIAVYPISFVSDHLETLEEIGVELRDLALQAGAHSYFRIPAFGIYPKFIAYLADLILAAQGNKNNTVCLCKEMGGEKLSGCHLD